MKSVGAWNPESSTTCWIFRYSGRGILTVTLLSRTTVKRGSGGLEDQLAMRASLGVRLPGTGLERSLARSPPDQAALQ